MNCLCNLFDSDNILMLVIIALILVYLCNACGYNDNGCGCRG